MKQCCGIWVTKYSAELSGEEILRLNKLEKKYDLISDAFEQARSSTYGVDYLRRFIDCFVPMKASPVLLDIGCGTGIPLTKQLVKSGFQVIGVDISTEMIEKARRNVPEATFITGDIVSLVINRKFDGVLAWDSLFHLPLENQEKTIRKIIKMLNNDGILMFTTGGQAGELVSSMFDTEFYYSSLSMDHYERILVEEECEMLFNEIDDSRSKGHRVICCRKK